MYNACISAVTFQAAASAEYNYSADKMREVCQFIRLIIGWFEPLYYLGF